MPDEGHKRVGLVALIPFRGELMGDNPFARALEANHRAIEEGIMLPALVARTPFDEYVDNHAELHRRSLPVGHPVTYCPTDGVVGVLKGNIDTRMGHHSVECPLCGRVIPVGRFAIVLILSGHRRLDAARQREAMGGSKFDLSDYINKPTSPKA